MKKFKDIIEAKGKEIVEVELMNEGHAFFTSTYRSTTAEKEVATAKKAIAALKKHYPDGTWSADVYPEAGKKISI
jgi:hypothetical protein